MPAIPAKNPDICPVLAKYRLTIQSIQRQNAWTIWHLLKNPILLLSVPSLLAEVNVVLSVNLIQQCVTNLTLVRNPLQLVLLDILSSSGSDYLSAEKVGEGKQIAYSQRIQQTPSALHLSDGHVLTIAWFSSHSPTIHFFWNSLCTAESDIDFMQPR